MIVMDGRLYFRPDERLEALSFTLHQVQRINYLLAQIKMIDQRLDTLESYLVHEPAQSAQGSIRRSIKDLLSIRLDQVRNIYRRL